MEELGYDPGSLTVICADREDAMIEYIYLEMINQGGIFSSPITADNAAAGIDALPKVLNTKNVIIDANNADLFLHENIDESAFHTDLYHS